MAGYGRSTLAQLPCDWFSPERWFTRAAEDTPITWLGGPAMTLGIALQGTDGVVLAADSRAIHEEPKNQGMKLCEDGRCKLHGVTTRAALCIQGRDDYEAEFLRRVRGELGPDDDIETVCRRCCSKMRELYSNYFPGLPIEKTPETNLLLVGLTSGPNPIPRIVHLAQAALWAPREPHGGYEAIGLWLIARYLLRGLYRKGLNVATLSQIAVFVLGEAIAVTPELGAPIHVARVTLAGRYQLLTQEVVETLKKDNETRREQALACLREQGAGDLVCEACWQPGELLTG